MALTTTVGGVWTLQALLGVETMPAVLRIKPFIPSVHESLIVETTAGPLPLNQTGEYLGLVEAGVIDASGHVDDVVRDWMTVLGRPGRQVVVSIRRPAGEERGTPIVHERAVVVCRHRRWMAMAARDGDEVVIDAVGEADGPDEQVQLMCAPLLAALGQAPPRADRGRQPSRRPAGLDVGTAAPAAATRSPQRWAGWALQPAQAEVLTAATRPDESAMAVVAVVDHGISHHVHRRVLTVADTDYGRISMTTTVAADGKTWMSVWPASNAALHDDLAELLALPRAA